MVYSFKGIFDNSTKDLSYFKDFEGEILDPTFITNCIEHLVDIQNKIYSLQSFEQVNDFCLVAIEDLMQLKKESNQTKQTLIVINYLQFYLTTKTLRHTVTTGQFNRALRWVTVSLCDDLSDSQIKEVDPFRFHDYLVNDTLRSVLNLEELTLWIGDFFYICRKLSAYHNIAEQLTDFGVRVTKLALHNHIYDAYTWAYPCLIAWATATNNSIAQKLVSEVERVVNNKIVPKQYATQLVLCLTTSANKYAEKSMNEWAKILISDYGDYLRGHQKLQALVTLLPTGGSESITQIVEDIRSEIQLLKKELNEKLHDEKYSSQTIQHERLIEMISPTFDRLLTAEKVTLLYQVLFDWYQTPDLERLDVERTLIIFPNSSMGLKVGIDDKTELYARDVTSIYSSLVKASNQFLGVSESIRGIQDFDFWEHLPDRIGVPNEEFSNEFYSNLVDFYGVELTEIKKFIEVNSNSIDSYICLPSKHHPIQYVMQKSLGACWPLAASLKKANANKVITRVCLWCGAGSLTEELESNILVKIFESLDLEVTLFSSHATTKEEFIKVYQSNEFDIIWVMSHGEFDHWKPGEVAMEVGNGDYLTLDEAMSLSIPECNHRRLLFLNICDGGTHRSTEGIERLGLAPALASNKQCVISHLWPVTAWSAATFGTIYSSYLTAEGDFFSAYKLTLETMAGGNNSVNERLSEISEHCTELIERLNNQNNNFDLLAHSGSSVFIQ